MFFNSNKQKHYYNNNKYENKSSNVINLLKKMSSKQNSFQEGNRDDLIPFKLEFEYTCTLNSTEGKKEQNENSKTNDKEEHKKQNNPFLPLYEGSSSIGGGLNNMGNTCFLNSVLQSVMFTLPMNNYFLRSNHLRVCKVKNNVCLLCEFCKLCNELQNRRALTPYNIIRNIKLICKHIRIGRQEDAHEFFIYLLDALEKSYTTFSKFSNSKFIVDNKGKNQRNCNLIQNVFGGELSSEVQCMKCKKSSVTIDKFLSISLEILNSDSIERSLDKFCKSELLFGANRFLCEHCKQKNDSRKRFLFKTLPNVLVLHLKRFDNYGQKIQRFIRYPMELDMGKYVVNPQKSSTLEGGTKYRLYSILIHNGYSSDSGHYYSFLKSEKGWYEMNDSYVERVQDNYAMNQAPYMFFYKKINIGKTVEGKSERKMSVESKEVKKEEEKKEAPQKIVWKNDIINIDNLSDLIYKNEKRRRIEKLKRIKKMMKHHRPIEEQKVQSVDNIDINEERENNKEETKEEAKNENIDENDFMNNPAFLEMKKHFEQNKDKIDHLYNDKHLEEDEDKKEQIPNKYNNKKYVPSKLTALYHSNKISTWDDDDEEEEKNQHKEELIQNQLNFMNKEKNVFLNKKLKQKSEYDKKLDKGKTKKVKKEKKKHFHSNMFQHLSDRMLLNNH